MLKNQNWEMSLIFSCLSLFSVFTCQNDPFIRSPVVTKFTSSTLYTRTTAASSLIPSQVSPLQCSMNTNANLIMWKDIFIGSFLTEPSMASYRWGTSGAGFRNILHKPHMLWLLSVYSLTPQSTNSTPLGSFHTVLQTSQIHCQTLYFLLFNSAQIIPFQKVLSVYSRSWLWSFFFEWLLQA